MRAPGWPIFRADAATPPRVLMFCMQFHPTIGGAEKAAERLSRELVARGSSVEVLTIRVDPTWPSEEERASGVGPERVTHVPNGVELPDQPSSLPRHATRFLYLGRLAGTAPRDVAGLIRAFEGVARSNRELELALVGGGDRLVQTRD